MEDTYLLAMRGPA